MLVTLKDGVQDGKFISRKINMRCVKIVTLVSLLSIYSYGAQSKILGAIGKFMPSVTELWICRKCN